MTLEKAEQLIKMHAELGSGYNRNAARLVLGEVMRKHGQDAVDKLIIKYNLNYLWQIKVGTRFTI